MTLEEAKREIEQIQREKLEKDSPDLREALKLLAEELNTKETHFILEILQNAEDNEYSDMPELSLSIDTGNPTVTPSADGCLVVLNNEVGFQLENVRSLSSVGQSTKKNRNQGYIGEKGIGFKSVFRVTDSPHIFSNGFQFRFQIPTESEGFGYILPHWVEAVPPVVKEGFTGILLPLQPGKRELIAHQLSKIAPETILFLRKLKQLAVGDSRSISRDDGNGSLVTLRSNGGESFYFVHSEPFEKPQDFTEEKRMGISQREVTVAFPLKTAAACKGRIFAFLPTEFDSGLPFLVNADFILNSNRERVLEDRRWNQWLRDEVAPTFVKAFLLVLNEPEWKANAYQLLPIAADLTPGADFFAPIVESVRQRLRTEKCVLTQAGNLAFPEQAHCANDEAIELLHDAPPERARVALVHPTWGRHWERLKPLGVQSLTFVQLFDACNDDAWLNSRNAGWWKMLFQLCADRKVTAEIIGSFPILRCQDGKCRSLTSGVFLQPEGQPSRTAIPPGWPAVHLLDADLQSHLQQNPTIWAWLTQIAGLRAFSVQAYITDSLLNWMREQIGENAAERLVEATRFIATNLKHLDTPTQQTLRERMTWVLSDGGMLLPGTRGGKEVITPECLENDIGWNLLFCALDRHFLVIHDNYCAGLSGDSLAELRVVFKACGATAYPDPRLRELNPGDLHYNEALARCAHAIHGTPKLRDWAAPGWLLGLESVEQMANGQRKVGALERWLKALGPDNAERLLYCSKPGYKGDWHQINVWSEFGGALRKKAWLRTTKGYVVPTTAFLNTPEFREFFGDSVAYVATDIATPLLEKLDVRVHLTAEVLIGQLREMRGSTQPDLSLMTKIYRRLQDSTFDASLFCRESLIFLSDPTPRWLSADKVVWDDAGELFGDDFGYGSLTYGKSELHGFFTEKLKIPAQPELRHYATAWKSLWLASSADRQTVERKLKAILPRLADSRNELSNSGWWGELKPQLRFWTDRGEFQPPARVYVPDHSIAVELFAGRIHIAFPPKPNRTVLGFLNWAACRSLAAIVQTRLAGAAGEIARSSSTYLTPAAKELCVLLVCSQHGWERRCLLLQALLESTEVGVKEISVEYSLSGNPEAGTRSQTRDAHWEVASRRLLLRDGVDAESLRDAAAKSIAAEFFGEAASTEMEAEFFRVLTVALERAQKLMRERTNWRLTPQQQDWLREQRWQILITELDEVEQPPASRPLAGTPPPNTTAPPSAAASSQPSSTEKTAAAQGTGGVANKNVSTTPSQRNQESPRSDTPTTPTTRQEQKPQMRSASDAPAELHDATTTTADFVEVRAHTRSRPQRLRSQQTEENCREAASGLTTASADEKTTLEQCGRAFAASKLASMGYKVTAMSQRNPGFDLKAEKPGDTLKIEVKAHAGEASSVFITQREWEEHLRTRGISGEAWELWNVQNLAKGLGKKPTIQRVRHIPKLAMRESGYWIDLNQCSHEEPK